MKITYYQIWQFFYRGGGKPDAVFEELFNGSSVIDKQVFDQLRASTIESIFCGYDVAVTQSIGGDDIAEISNDIVKAMTNNRQVYTYYGNDEAEIIIFSVDKDDFTIIPIE